MKLVHLRNSSLNLIGQVIPLFVGLATMPMIIRGLGEERFSLLTIAWAALGYFTLFDMGLGRATTRALADVISRAQSTRISDLFWSSNLSLFIVSGTGALVLALAAPFVVGRLKDVSEALKPEITWSLVALALSLPIVTLTANLRGVMEAQKKFLGINILQILVGSLSYLAPLLALGRKDALFHVISALIAIRVLSFVAHLGLTVKSLKGHIRRPRIDRRIIKDLWSFGGWLTVSNIIGPILYYFDRFVLGLLLPVKLVGYYTTPIEVVTRLWIIPSSVTRVLFPEFSAAVTTDSVRAKRMYRRSVFYLAIAMSVPCAILGGFADFILLKWLGSEFALQASQCLRIICFGVWINSIAWIPYTFLQSAGRTRTIAYIHLSELLPYGLTFWLLTRAIGLEGAAWAWTLRGAFDAALMFLFANRELRSLSISTGSSDAGKV